MAETTSHPMTLEEMQEKYESSRKNLEIVQKAKMQLIQDGVNTKSNELLLLVKKLEEFRSLCESYNVMSSPDAEHALKIVEELYPMKTTDEFTTSQLESLYKTMLERLQTGKDTLENSIAFSDLLKGRSEYEKNNDRLFVTNLQQLVQKFQTSKSNFETLQNFNKRLVQDLQTKSKIGLEAKAKLLQILQSNLNAQYAELPGLAEQVSMYADLFREVDRLEKDQVVQKARYEFEKAQADLTLLVKERKVTILQRVEHELLQRWKKFCVTADAEKMADIEKVQKALKEIEDGQKALESFLVQELTATQEGIGKSYDLYQQSKRDYQDFLKSLQDQKQVYKSRWPELQDEDFDQRVTNILLQEGVIVLNASDSLGTDPQQCLQNTDKMCSVTLKPYQIAIAKILGGPQPFLELKGLLAIWDTGTGKTLAASNTIVSRFVSVKECTQCLVCGFSVSNLLMFFKEINKCFALHNLDTCAMQPMVRGNQFTETGSDHTTFTFYVQTKLCTVYFVRMHLQPETHVAKCFFDDPYAFTVVDEAHFLVQGPPPKGTANVSTVTLQKWINAITNQKGQKLLLSATPVGKNSCIASEVQGLLQILKMLNRPLQGTFQDGDENEWFEMDPTVGTRWKSDEARLNFQNNWVRGAISYVSLKFDQAIYPAIATICDPKADSNKACMWKFDPTNKSFLLSQSMTLTEAQKEYAVERDYQNLVPFIIMVPQSAEASAELQKRFKIQSDLIECSQDSSLSGSKECADRAKGIDQDGVAHGYKYTSGGGYDYKHKGEALRAQIDSFKDKSKKHLIFATLNPKIPYSYYENDVIKPLEDAKNFSIKQGLVQVPLKKLFGSQKSIEEIFATWDLSKRWYVNLLKVDSLKEDDFGLKLFNHPMNAAAKYIEAMIVSGKRLTGLDVPGVHVMYFLSPPQDKTAQKQAYGRILRQCALANYASMTGDRDPFVRVFTFVSYIPCNTEKCFKTPFVVTPDELLLSWLLGQKTGKTATDLLLDQMKRGAVDAYFFGSYSTGINAIKKFGGEKMAEPQTESDDVLLFLLEKAMETGDLGKQNETKTLEQFALDYYNPITIQLTQVEEKIPTMETIELRETLIRWIEKQPFPDFAALALFLSKASVGQKSQLLALEKEKVRITPKGTLEKHRARTNLLYEADNKRILKEVNEYELKSQLIDQTARLAFNALDLQK